MLVEFGRDDPNDAFASEGGVPEWLKGPVSKTGVPLRGTEGSNPSSSAIPECQGMTSDDSGCLTPCFQRGCRRPRFFHLNLAARVPECHSVPVATRPTSRVGHHFGHQGQPSPHTVSHGDVEPSGLTCVIPGVTL